MTAMTELSRLIVLTQRKNWIAATIKFGIITEQCKGKGICSITTDGPDFKAAIQCNNAKAIIHTEPNNSLTISFEKSSMNEYTRKKYFGLGLFEVTEAFTVPPSILTPLILNHYLIDTGEYKVQETELYFKVKF